MSDVTDILDDLQWRNLIASSTDLEHLRAAMEAGPITLYCGFDPTAPSLHLGNLSQILTVRRFQLAGHRPLALVGGATGLIGDPKMTGERVLNEATTVDEWVARIRGQLERFYSFDGESAAIVVNNYDWISKLSAIEFLRDVGKHFSVNRMLDREAVAVRLAGPGISYTEFSYALLQGYDFLELSRRHDCTLQTGGSDQWGNITAGIDLIRRVDSRSVHGLTTPLITKADGTKFGKTESGTVWLDPNLTSPYAFYQFWINVDDRDVPTLLRTFSFKSREDIEALEQATQERPHAREAQRALAEELTSLVHGEAATRSVKDASQAIFGQGDLADLDPSTLSAALSETPVVELTESAVAQGFPSFIDLLAQSGLVASKGAARRTVAEGGAYLNNVRVTDDAATPTSEDLIHGSWLVLRRGKKSLAAVRVTPSQGF